LKQLAVVLPLTFSPQTAARDIVSTRDLWNTNPLEIKSIEPEVSYRYMNHIEDWVHFSSSAQRQDPGYWHATEWLDQPLHTSSDWQAFSGGWNSSRFSMPQGFGNYQGPITLYDPTPNTPGLYQFVTLTYDFQLREVVVVHSAWMTADSALPAIPSVGTLGLLSGFLNLKSLRPSRSRQKLRLDVQ
jgi:hypothetical protein